MGRYNVQFKAFKTGEWYVNSSTDFINSAYSVAYTSNYGRAYRIIDTETDTIMAEKDEEVGAAEASKSYRKY